MCSKLHTKRKESKKVVTVEVEVGIEIEIEQEKRLMASGGKRVEGE